MITEFSAHNFKSLKNVEIYNLARINIIVGQSAAGKSALIESMRLALAANPAIAFNILSTRGYFGFTGHVTSKDQFEGIWAPLFTDYRTDEFIFLKSSFDDRPPCSARFYFDDTIVTNVNSQPPSVVSGMFVPFSVKAFRVDREAFALASTVTSGVDASGAVYFSGEEMIGNSELLPSIWQPNAFALAERFSHLSVDNEEFEILEAVRFEFPDVMGLSIQGTGPNSSVHAAMKGVRRKIPLSSVSSGINKFVSILIAIKSLKNGTLFIDEVENGIYFKLLPRLWRALHYFAQQYNVQLFVTTHSLECIKAAQLIIANFSRDFALLQLQRIESATQVFVTPGENFYAALDSDIELRR